MSGAFREPAPAKSLAGTSVLGSAIATAVSKRTCNTRALQDLCYSYVNCSGKTCSEIVESFNQVRIVQNAKRVRM